MYIFGGNSFSDILRVMPEIMGSYDVWSTGQSFCVVLSLPRRWETERTRLLQPSGISNTDSRHESTWNDRSFWDNNLSRQIMHGSFGLALLTKNGHLLLDLRPMNGTECLLMASWTQPFDRWMNRFLFWAYFGADDFRWPCHFGRYRPHCPAVSHSCMESWSRWHVPLCRFQL